MAKPICPQCGSRNVRRSGNEEGSSAVCKVCGAKLRLRKKKLGVESPDETPKDVGDGLASGVVPSAPLDSDERETKLASVAVAPADSRETPQAQAVDTNAGHRIGEETALEWDIGDVILELYEVTGVLGEGGMGRVHRVHHRGWNTDLAVKSPKKEILERVGGAEAFKQEAETWVKLGLHPHIVSCYYVRNLDGVPRVFAEYVQGGSLHDWITDRRLYRGGPEKTLERIIDVSIQFAWGLHYAHEQGLVHQDVKPGNVMMTPECIAKVTDFGLAGVKGAAGTPAYRSPEQEAAALERASGTETAHMRRPDPSADLWSWAVSILEMFNGEITWVSGTLAPLVLEEIRANFPKDTFLPPMPEQVASLLMSCFDESPPKRPQSMLVTAQILEDAYLELFGKPFGRRLPPVASDSAENLNNRAVSLIDLGNSKEAERLLKQALEINPYHPQATFNHALLQWRGAKITDLDAIAAMREIGQSTPDNPTSALLLSRIHRERGNVHEAREVLESYLKTAPANKEIQDDLKTIRSRCRGIQRSIAAWKGGPNSLDSLPAMTRDARYVVTTRDGDDTVELRDGRTGSLIRGSEKIDGSITALCVSEDGRRVVTGEANGRVFLWDATMSHPLHEFHGHTRPVRSVCMSADGKHVLSGSEDGTSRLWNAGTGILNSVLDNGSVPVECTCFSGNGSLAATAGWGQKRSSERPWLCVWDVTTGQRVRAFHGSEGANQPRAKAICLSHDGGLLLTGTREVQAWDTLSGRCLFTFNRNPVPVACLHLTSDERYVWCGTMGGKLELLELSTGRCLCTQWFLQGISRLLLREEEFNLPLIHAFIPSDDGRHVLHSRGMMQSHEMWVLDRAEPYPAPFALCRIIASEQAVDTDTEYRTQLAAAVEALAHNDLKRAAEAVRKARSLPRCSTRKEALQTWLDLYRKLPRKELKGLWQVVTLGGHPEGMRAVGVSQDGLTGLSGSTDGKIRIWSIGTGELLHDLQFPRLWDYDMQILCHSGDGRYLVAGSTNSSLILYDLLNRRRIGQIDTGLPYRIGSICLSHDDKFVLASGETRDGGSKSAAHLLHIATGKRLRSFQTTEGALATASLSPDSGRVLLCSYTGRIDLYDSATGGLLGSFQLDASYSQVYSALFSGRGVTALVSVKTDTRGSQGHEQLILVDTSDGSVRASWPTISGIRHAGQLTSDGHYGVSVDSVHSSIVLYDLWSGAIVRRLDDRMGGGLNAVGLSPDGRYLLRGNRNGEVTLWVLDWELEDRHPADWDESAGSYCKVFLHQHVPYEADLPVDHDPSDEELTRALTRSGRPTWSEADFNRFLHTLGCVGCGWLRPEGVKRKLEEMVAEWPDSTNTA